MEKHFHSKKHEEHNNEEIVSNDMITKADFEGLEFPSDDPLRWNFLLFVSEVASSKIGTFNRSIDNDQAILVSGQPQPNISNKNLSVNEDGQNINDNNVEVINDGSIVLPDKFRKKIEKLGGTDLRLIIRKNLFRSDVKKGSTRFSFPKRKVLDPEFLTNEEKEYLENNGELGIVLIGPDCKLVASDMKFKQWNMHKNTDRVSPQYVFISGWYRDVVTKQNLVRDDLVHLWSFRSNEGKICFALELVKEN